jgi:hypothetical protein
MLSTSTKHKVPFYHKVTVLLKVENCKYLFTDSNVFRRRDDVVAIATRYGLEGPGVDSRWGKARFSAPIQTGSEPHPASCKMGTGSFPGVKAAGVWS